MGGVPPKARVSAQTVAGYGVAPMRIHVAAAAATAAVVAGCGGGSSSSTVCSPAAAGSPGPSSVAAGALTAAVDRGSLPAGTTVHLRVSARGPASYTAPCDGPLQLLVAADPADIHIYTAAPPGAHGTPCGAASLAAGQEAEYDVDWTPEATLPAGVYRAVLTLGDQPPLILRVAVGTSPVVASCPG